MLKEFVGFELAKLAYEKGFDDTCIGYVDKDNNFSTRIKVTNTKLQKQAKEYKEKYKCSLPEFFAAPTPLVLLDWIAVKTGHLIEIRSWKGQPHNKKIIERCFVPWLLHDSIGSFNETYVDAVNEGLSYVLKMLPTKNKIINGHWEKYDFAQKVIERVTQLQSLGCILNDYGFRYISKKYPDRYIQVAHVLFQNDSEDEDWELIMKHFMQRKELIDNDPNFKMPVYHYSNLSMHDLLFFNLNKEYV